MSTRIHVGNIPSTAAEKDLLAVFGQFGPVELVQIARDTVTGVSRGFATVCMTHDSDAATAISRLNFSQYAGRTIGVGRARDEQPLGQ